MIVDLHVHTDATESGRSVPEIVGALEACGLDGVALTDVGVISAPQDVSEVFEESGLSVFFGVELPTETGRWLLYPPDAVEAAERRSQAYVPLIDLERRGMGNGLGSKPVPSQVIPWVSRYQGKVSG